MSWIAGLVPGAIALTIAVFAGHWILDAPVMGQVRYLALIIGFVIPAGALLGSATIFSLGDVPEKEPEKAKQVLKVVALLVAFPTIILIVDAVMRRATLADMAPLYGLPLIWAGWLWRKSSFLNESDSQ